MNTENSQNNLREQALELHKKYKGKWGSYAKTPLETQEDLRLAYSPGVAEPCKEIAEDPENAYLYTSKGNTVAVISNGTAVLGLGNIGALASLPVMEGKALLFKRFANIDALPIVINETDPEKLIPIIRALAPSFGGINLEDIKAPECFIVERGLQDLGIPVMHDDQHGTAIVILAGLMNALKVVDKVGKAIKIVVVGAGAAGHATVELLHAAQKHKYLTLSDIIVCDSKGIISSQRGDLDPEKQKLLSITNTHSIEGSLDKAVVEADVIIGLSQPGAFTEAHIAIMAPKPVIFALANPTPELMPEAALQAGAWVVATGRSDFPNQINNALAFPGIFRGLLDNRITQVTTEHMLAVSQAIALLVPEPSQGMIVPGIFDERVSKAVAEVFKA